MAVVDLTGFDPEVQEAFQSGEDRVRNAQRKTVADQWYVGNALDKLRETVRGMAGVPWFVVYGKQGLGYSESTQWRLRKLARAYTTAEEAGRFTSVNKALRAKEKDATKCPGWWDDGVLTPGCDGTRTAGYRFCRPCTAAWSKCEQADAATKRKKRVFADRLLKAMDRGKVDFDLPDDLPEETLEQVEDVIKKAVAAVEVAEELRRQRDEALDACRSKDEWIARLQDTVNDQDERLEMVDQRSLPVPGKTPTVGARVRLPGVPGGYREKPPARRKSSHGESSRPTNGWKTDWDEVVP